MELPQLVKPLLNDYISMMEKKLPRFMSAFYLHGSIALGAFQPPLSDIDFITVISWRSSENDIERLALMHEALKQKYPDLSLSGSYLQRHDVGQFEDAVEPHPYYHDGVLHPSGQHEINSVTWWLLKNHGIQLGAP